MNACEVYECISRYAALSEPFFFMLDYAGAQGHFIGDPELWSSGFRPDSACGDAVSASTRLYFKIGHRQNFIVPAYREDCRPEFRVYPPAYSDYKTGFDKIQAGLRRGDSFLANYTARSRVETNLGLDEIFFRSRAPYKVLLPGEFVCFSPEIFIRIDRGIISTYPMKGTISADTPDAPSKLLQDYKESCEHATVVDLLRNDLSSVAEKVRIKRYRYLEKIPASDGKEIWQSSSEITGSLPGDWKRNLGDILRKLLPAGSISGAPKPATLKLIGEAEAAPRGWYTGVCGYFDGENLDTAVMIRCLAVDPAGVLYFHSGGGITVHSRAEDEYAELVTKVYLPVGLGDPQK